MNGAEDLRVDIPPPDSGESSTRVGKLNTLAHVRKELARLYRSARRTAGKDIDPSNAAKLGYLLMSIGRTVLEADLERRMGDLERRLEEEK